jgi:uncharacterized glyoxalase superfamily protein PhnB
MTDAIVRSQGVRLQAAAPTFLATDVGRTADWYNKTLGFRTAGTVPASEPYVYASLQRDGVELMLLHLAGYQKPDFTGARPEGVWDAYVRMQGVQAFYELVRERTPVRSPLRKQPYGDWEFEIEDPNGYILVFSELGQ